MNSINENFSKQVSLPTRTNPPQFWARLSEGPLRLRVESDVRLQPQFAPPPPPVREIKQRPAALRRQLLMLAAMAVLSILSYYLVSRFIITAVVVQGRSMAPTFRDGERCFLNRWVYLFATPQRGDVVVIKDPGHSDYAVKRIIGGPHDRLHFKDGSIYLNGEKLSEPYLDKGTATIVPNYSEKWIEIGNDRYYLLGDNRANSEDSRYYGQVRRSQIIGKICR